MAKNFRRLQREVPSPERFELIVTTQGAQAEEFLDVLAYRIEGGLLSIIRESGIQVHFNLNDVERFTVKPIFSLLVKPTESEQLELITP